MNKMKIFTFCALLFSQFVSAGPGDVPADGFTYKHFNFYRNKLYSLNFSAIKNFYSPDSIQVPQLFYKGHYVTDFLPLAGGTLTGPLNGTTASFSGSVSLTNGALISSYPAVFNQTTQGANPAYGYFQNTGGLLCSGREGSSGGLLIPFSSPYASIINSTGAYPLQIGVNNSIALTLASSGAATFASSVSLNGALISSYPAVFNQTTQGTNPAYAYFQNTGGFLYSGREGSAGGALVPYSSPYASIINSTGAYPLQIGVNNSIALTLAASGAAAFAGSVSLTNGALISSYPAVFNQTTQGANPAYGYFQNTGGLLCSGREGSGGGSLIPFSSPYASIINSTGAYPLQIGVNNSIALTLASSGAATFTGNVAIGTTPVTERLSVDGNAYVHGNISAKGVVTTKKVIVTQLGWSDYVFNSDYKLRSLSSLETFIVQNKHLPEVPSAKEVGENGISVGDTQALLLKKIEELTLYIIQQQKQIDCQNKEIKSIKKRIS